jgi:hypothetical protein
VSILSAKALTYRRLLTSEIETYSLIAVLAIPFDLCDCRGIYHNVCRTAYYISLDIYKLCVILLLYFINTFMEHCLEIL